MSTQAAVRDLKEPVFPTFADSELLITKTIRLDGDDPEQKRQEILTYFHKTFTLYERLFETLKDDDVFFVRANTLRHPLIFYYGHTATFFINKLNVMKLIDQRIDPKIESMMAIGVDEMSWDDLNERHYDWPSPAEILTYRDRTREIVDHFIRTCPITLPITQDNPLWIILMAIEHERIHLETSAVLIRELPVALVKKDPLWTVCPDNGTAPQNELRPVAGQQITLGKEHNSTLYGWDCEYGHYETTVKDFKASQYIVSNGEFLEFVKDNGYEQEKHWTEEGWEWRNFQKAEHPVYWSPDGNSYRYRAMLEIIDMPWDWPVDVNQLEAKAFCNWKAEKTEKTIRLPTEAEWSVLREQIDTDQPDWDKAPGNINLEHYASACPVNRFATKDGFYDVIGNVWQWTETPVDAFPGFKPHPTYDDFSTPTFDGKHNLFKGGSWISTGNEATRDARYAFRRHFFQNAGFRYVEAVALETPKTNVYESDALVSQYIEFHYGDCYFDVPNFPKKCADICLGHMKDRKTERALDIGCATGRSAFELAKTYAHVDALDFSVRFIQIPVGLQQTGLQRYTIQDEGELVSYKEANLSEMGLRDTADRVNFMQGDACNLPPKFTDYDLVFAGNLIDRLYDPEKFLSTIQERIRSGGVLVITSPYTWLEEFTPCDKWVGGFKADTGETYTTLDGLKESLSPHFNFVENQDVPFVIRETRRKFHHCVSEMSVWVKK